MSVQTGQTFQARIINHFQPQNCLPYFIAEELFYNDHTQEYINDE